MIRSTDIQPDTYKSGQYLRRWSISENGQAVCVEDAYPVADTEQATLDAQSERNVKIKQALADVEALEAARLVPEPEGDIPKTVVENDIEGNKIERPYKPWAEYDLAVTTIAGANELTQKLEVVRKGKVNETLPVYKDVEKTITNEEGNESTITESVINKDAAPIANPDYPAYKAAWNKVNADLN